MENWPGRLRSFISLFSELGIEKGDKISLVGKNHSSWSILFMATITYGAVIVPILHEFTPKNITHIIRHSDSRLLFINNSLWQTLPTDDVSIPVFEIPSFSLLNGDDATKDKVNFLDEIFSRRYPEGFTKEDIQYADLPNEEVVCLNYTSGTAGFCKGVMITANNFAGNVTYGKNSDCSSAENEPWLFCPYLICMAACLIFYIPSLSGHISRCWERFPHCRILFTPCRKLSQNSLLLFRLPLKRFTKEESSL